MSAFRLKKDKALLLGTILAGSVPSLDPALASQATGCTPAGGTSGGSVICTTAGNTYTSGIEYIPASDLDLTVQSGVLITGSQQTNAGISVSRGPNFPFPAVNVSVDNQGTVTFLNVSTVGIGVGVQGDHTIQVNNGGALTAGSGIVTLLESSAVGTGQGSITVENSGTLSVIDGIDAEAGGNVAFGSVQVSVVNSGTLQGRVGVYELQDGIRAEANTGPTGTSTVSVSNTGRISAISDGIIVGGKSGIYNATIRNEGTVAASTPFGYAVEGNPSAAGGLITLTNAASGVIAADGQSGVAVSINAQRLQSSPSVFSSASPDITVDNAGLISVMGDAAAPARSAAVLIASGGVGTVTNSGSITATNARVALGLAPESLAESARGFSNAGPTAFERSVLDNTGTISSTTSSAILAGDQPTTITNAGTITTGVAGGVAIGMGGGSNRLAITPTSTIVGFVINGISSQLVVDASNTPNISAPVPAAGSTVTVNALNTLALSGSGSGTFDLGQLAPTPAQLGYTPVNSGAQYQTANYTPDAVHQYQGFSQLQKLGDSTWALTGATDFDGPTTVAAGQLLVQGSLAQSSVTVATGGQIGGSGTIGGLRVLGGGLVAQAAGSPLAALQVAGNVEFQPGSNYQVRIASTGETDAINAAGTATLGGGTVSVLGGSGPYNVGTSYTILTAAGGRTGTFGNLTTTSDLAFLTPQLAYDATHVTLELVRRTVETPTPPTDNPPAGTGNPPTGTGNPPTGTGAPPTGTGNPSTGTGTPSTGTDNPTTGTSNPPTGTSAPPTGQTGTPITFATVATTPNQRATADALEGLGQGNPLYDAVLSQSVAGARQAFNTASGEIHASASTAGIEGTRLERNAIFGRLDAPNAGSGSGAYGALGSFGPTAPQLPPAAQGYAPVPASPAVPAVLPYAAWGSGFGDFGQNGGNGNAAALDRSLGGFILGVDTQADGPMLGRWRIGVAGGYTSDDLRVRNRSASGSFETYFGGLYAGTQYGAWTVKLGALGGGTSTDIRRTIAFPGILDSTRASYSGAIAQGFGEIGYKVQFASGTIEPLFQGAAIHIGQDGFREQGGAAALIGFGRDTDVQTTTLGAKAEAALPFGGVPLIARSFLGWRHAFGDVDPRAVLAFAVGSPSFAVSGAPIDRDAVVAEAGLDYRAAANLNIGISYAGQAGERAYDNAVTGRLDYRF